MSIGNFGNIYNHYGFVINLVDSTNYVQSNIFIKNFIDFSNSLTVHVLFTRVNNV